MKSRSAMLVLLAATAHGGQAKSSGELQCLYFKDGAKYECAFSLDLIEHKVEYGVAC